MFIDVCSTGAQSIERLLRQKSTACVPIQDEVGRYKHIVREFISLTGKPCDN